MNPSTRLIVAAIALLTGVSVAAAADNSMSKTKTANSSPMSQSSSQPMAKDMLSLTSKQQREVWEDIRQQGEKQKAPKGFVAKVGAVMPSTIATHPVPVSTANDVPALRPYNYALLANNKLLIVDPKDKKVVKIITG